MKHNVDLTLERVFRDNSFSERSFYDAYHNILESIAQKKIYPWHSLKDASSLEPLDDKKLSAVHSDDELRYAPLVVTGNAEERRREKRQKAENHLKICEYWGKRYYKWPWSHERNCSCFDFYEEKKEYPWNKKNSKMWIL